MMKPMRHIMCVGIIGAGLCIARASFAQTISDVVNQVSQTTYQYYLDDLLYTHSLTISRATRWTRRDISITPMPLR